MTYLLFLLRFFADCILCTSCLTFVFALSLSLSPSLTALSPYLHIAQTLNFKSRGISLCLCQCPLRRLVELTIGCIKLTRPYSVHDKSWFFFFTFLFKKFSFYGQSLEGRWSVNGWSTFAPSLQPFKDILFSHHITSTCK